MLRIKFRERENEIRGYYLLATRGWVKSLRGGIYEIGEETKKFLDEEKIPYEKTKDEGISEDEALRNSLAVSL